MKNPFLYKLTFLEASDKLRAELESLNDADTGMERKQTFLQLLAVLESEYEALQFELMGEDL